MKELVALITLLFALALLVGCGTLPTVDRPTHGMNRIEKLKFYNCCYNRERGQFGCANEVPEYDQWIFRE